MISKKDARFAPSHVCPPWPPPSAAPHRKLTGKGFPGTGKSWRIAGKSHAQTWRRADGDGNGQRGPLNIRLCAARRRYGSTPHLISGYPYPVTGFAGRRRYPMISNKTVAAQFSSNRDRDADGGDQGPYVSAEYSRIRQLRVASAKTGAAGWLSRSKCNCPRFETRVTASVGARASFQLMPIGSVHHAPPRMTPVRSKYALDHAALASNVHSDPSPCSSVQSKAAPTDL